MGRRIGIGLLLVVLGSGFLVQQLDVFHFSDILSTWWPLILIIIGLMQMLNSRHSSTFPGIFLLLLGIIFLGREVYDINLFKHIWPLFLICIGLVFIFSKGHRERGKTDSKDVIDSLSLFSGVSVRSVAKNFKGGDVMTLFGGAKIDLRDVELAPEHAHLNLVSIFGGVTLFIPEEMQIEVSGTPIFGGWDDKTKATYPADDLNPVLHIKCLPIFGGVEIRN